MLTLLKVVLAHTIVDSVPWPSRDGRKRHPVPAGLLPSVAFAAMSVLLLSPDLTIASAIVLLVTTASRVAVDVVSASFDTGGVRVPLVRQAAHLLLVAGAAWAITATRALDAVATLRSILASPRILLFVTVYVGTVFGGGHFVQHVTRHFLAQIDQASLKPGLPAAGKYIGWLERFLILTFLVSDYGEAVGFLLAAKAVARYPEIKDDTKGHFAEYFLIGTLSSVGLALLGGILLVVVAKRL